jgi:hypothetical protein
MVEFESVTDAVNVTGAPASDGFGADVRVTFVSDFCRGCGSWRGTK